MRLPNGVLKELAIKTGIPKTTLSDYASTRKRPSRLRSLTLEKTCNEMGLDVPAALWLLGDTVEIKKALANNIIGNAKI